MATNQNLRQASVRASTGTSYVYNDDWMALFTAAGFTTGTFNDRMKAWINGRLSTSYLSLNDAQKAFAINQGFTSWNEMGTFEANGTALSLLFYTYSSGADLAAKGVTFTRASTATYYNSSGILTTAASGAPRFDYDPVTLAAKGLLIEESRTNLVTYSEDFTNANWTNGGSNSTITANATTAPDGATTADKLASSGSGAAVHQVYQIGKAITSGQPYTASVFFKAGEVTWGIVNIYDATSGDARVYFNLSAGTIGTVGAGATATITPVGNGWYRCTATKTAAAASGGLSIEYTSADNIISTAIPVNNGLYAWGADYGPGSFATSYIPTTSASVTRAAETTEMTGANFSSWFNPAEGTFVCEASTMTPHLASGDYAGPFVLTRADNAGLADRSGPMNDRGSGHIGLMVWSSGGASTDHPTSIASPSANVFHKLALAFKSGDSNLAMDGVVGATDTVAYPTMVLQRLQIGGPGAYVVVNYNGWIKSLTYYNTRKTNAELLTLTA